MIAAGLVEALPTGFTNMIRTCEVERLRSGQDRDDWSKHVDPPA
jgi:hypothetical protein